MNEKPSSIAGRTVEHQQQMFADVYGNVLTEEQIAADRRVRFQREVSSNFEAAQLVLGEVVSCLAQQNKADASLIAISYIELSMAAILAQVQYMLEFGELPQRPQARYDGDLAAPSEECL